MFLVPYSVKSQFRQNSVLGPLAFADCDGVVSRDQAEMRATQFQRSSVSLQKEPVTDLEYRMGKGLRLLLRKIVSCIDDAVFMQPDKHAGVLCGPTRLERVVRAIECHRRRLDRGFLGQ
jgi:hypothetical protein